MPILKLYTEINADRKQVFDLSRSIDLHTISASHTKEQAIAGRTSGLIGLGETVTWRAKHLGFTQNLTSKITALQYPDHFTDEMIEGAFHSFKHQHLFSTHDQGTLMIDIFEYTSPFGVLGRIADILFLKRYLIRFLEKRNQMIKEFAESEKWREILD